MMSIVIDDTTIKGLLGIAGSVSAGITLIVGYLFKKGYIDIWLTKLFTSTEVIHAVKKQNGNALRKLNIPDKLIDMLLEVAPGGDGEIDEQKAIELLHHCVEYNNNVKRKFQK